MADQTIGELKVNPCNNSTQITVMGAGSGTSVLDAKGANRLFDLFQNGSLDLQKLTLENGDGTGVGLTGGPYNNPGTAPYLPDGDGGAVDSDGHLALQSDVFTGNSVASGYGGAVAAEDVPGSTIAASGDVFQNNAAYEGGAVYTNAPNDVSIAFSLMQANNVSGGGGGGAIFGDSSAAGLTLSFDDLVQNVASGSRSYAGAVEWVGHGGGALNVTSSLFDQNQSSGGEAGAIEIDQGASTASISNTSFDSNTAASYAGALVDFGSQALKLTQDKFSGNSAADTGSVTGGGALYLDSNGKPPSGSGTTISSSEFDGNSAPGDDGGAIYWRAAPLSLLGDSFVGNSAGSGAALYAATSNTPLVMLDSTMSRNTASEAGGAIGFLVAGMTTPVTMTNDTIAFNNAPAGQGGGIDVPANFQSDGTAAGGFGVENTTVAENSGGDCHGTFKKSTDAGNNNDSDQSCFGGLGGAGDLVGVNPLLANPADSGGPAAGGPGDTETVQTDAEQSKSPTVDAGNNNGCPPVDERGVTRPQGKACDIGAFEFGAPPSTTVTSTPQTTLPPTRSTSRPPAKKPTRCASGKHRSRGKCVKNRKHRKRTKHKCPKGRHQSHGACVKRKK